MTLGLTVPGWVSPQFGGTASSGGPRTWDWDDPPPNPAIMAGYGSLEDPNYVPAGSTPSAATPTMPTPAAAANNGDPVIEVSPETLTIGVVIVLGLVLVATR